MDFFLVAVVFFLVAVVFLVEVFLFVPVVDFLLALVVFLFEEAAFDFVPAFTVLRLAAVEAFDLVEVLRALADLEAPVFLDLLLEAVLEGTFTPFLRATACFLFFTGLPVLPLFEVPFLDLLTAGFTASCEPGACFIVITILLLKFTLSRFKP